MSRMALSIPAMRMQQLQMQMQLKQLPYDMALKAARIGMDQSHQKTYESETENYKAKTKGQESKNTLYDKAMGNTSIGKDQASSDAFLAGAKGQFQPHNIPANNVMLQPNTGATTPGMLLTKPGEQVAGQPTYDAFTGKANPPQMIYENKNFAPGKSPSANKGQPTFGEIFKAAYDQTGDVTKSAQMAGEVMQQFGGGGTNQMGTLPQGTNAPPQGQGKPLDAQTAAGFLKQAGGDKNKARELAKQAGFTF